MTPRPLNPSRSRFEANLRRLMQSAGITTYKELATKADIRPHTIQRICSGVRQPSISTLMKLANALDVKIDDLLRFS